MPEKENEKNGVDQLFVCHCTTEKKAVFGPRSNRELSVGRVSSSCCSRQETTEYK